MTDSPIKPPAHGFTLIELSISLLIVGLLSSGLLLGLSAQRSMAEIQSAQQQLEHIRESLLGFALSNGRLPCPAKAQLASTDTQAGLEDCALQHGVIPWITLAIQESDPWGNRYTYYASERFSTPNDGSSASFTLETLGNAKIQDSNSKIIAAELPAVIVCHGRHATGAFLSTGLQVTGVSGEEQENADADLTFINHAASPDFDDQITWIVPSILKSRMVSAGKLP